MIVVAFQTECRCNGGGRLVCIWPIAAKVTHFVAHSLTNLFADPVALFADGLALGAQLLAKFPAALPGEFPCLAGLFASMFPSLAGLFACLQYLLARLLCLLPFLLAPTPRAV